MLSLVAPTPVVMWLGIRCLCPDGGWGSARDVRTPTQCPGQGESVAGGTSEGGGQESSFKGKREGDMTLWRASKTCSVLHTLPALYTEQQTDSCQRGGGLGDQVKKVKGLRKKYGHKQQYGDCQKERGSREWEEGKEGLCGGRKRLDFGWWACDMACRWWATELYTWNPYGFINQCHPNTLNKKLGLLAANHTLFPYSTTFNNK